MAVYRKKKTKSEIGEIKIKYEYSKRECTMDHELADAATCAGQKLRVPDGGTFLSEMASRSTR